MARIRTIKPEFWSSPDNLACSMEARLLYIAMWNWADDHGRGTANPKELAGFAFQHDAHIGASEVQSLLTEVADRFGVLLYKVNRRPYYAIPTWDKHQRNERKATSKYPGPDQADGADLRVSEPPQPSAPIVGSSDRSVGDTPLGTGEQGNRGTGEVPTTSALAKRDAEDPSIGEVVKAYVEGASNAGLPRPSERLRGKVGQNAKRLAAKEHVPIAALIAAARSMGERGWDDIDRELQRLAITTKPVASTTDQRVAQGRALADRYRAEEASA